MFDAIDPLSTTVADISNSKLQPEFVIPSWIHCAHKVRLIAASKADSRMQYPLHAPAHSMCVHVSNCCAAIGWLDTSHSCSLVTISFNAIHVYVFGKVVTPTNAAFCLHRAYRSTVTPPRNDSPLRVCVLTRTSAAYLYRPHEDGSPKETSLCRLFLFRSPTRPHSWNLSSNVGVSDCVFSVIITTASLRRLPRCVSLALSRQRISLETLVWILSWNLYHGRWSLAPASPAVKPLVAFLTQ